MSAHRHDPPILIETDRRTVPGRASGRGFSRHVTAVVFAVAALFAGGAALDLILLWGPQHPGGDATSEFFAIATTVENLPRLALGIALSVVALYLARSTMLLAYRLLGGLMLTAGLAGLGLAVLASMDYFELRSAVPLAQQSGLLIVASKTILLGFLEGVVLIPAGWRCFRRPT
jgi:hypothetical protein